MSEKKEEWQFIHADKYIDALPTFQWDAEALSKPIEAFLKSDLGPKLLALMEEQALLKEKEFTKIDFNLPSGVNSAVRLQGEISALRKFQELLIDIANKERNENDSPTSNSN